MTPLGQCVVSDEMIERAVRSWIVDTEPGDFIYARMRAALEAALTISAEPALTPQDEA